jgi:hypothetical protein
MVGITAQAQSATGIATHTEFAAQTATMQFDGDINPYRGNTRRPVTYGRFNFFKGNEYQYYFHPGDIEMEHIRWEYIGRDGFYTEEGAYRVSREGVYDYLYLNNTSPFNYREKLGILYHPRILYLFNQNELFFASDDGPRWGGLDPRITDIKVSSFLVEGVIRYDAFNFRRPTQYYLRPWVPGVQGDGIGEWIELALEGQYGLGPVNDSRPLDYFLVSNGYVSFTNPSLYEWNNRVKKLRVVCETEGIDVIYELADTPQFQELRLPRSITAETCNFRFIIEEVYKGTRWDDTCISMIIPVGEGSYPY